MRSFTTDELRFESGLWKNVLTGAQWHGEITGIIRRTSGDDPVACLVPVDLYASRSRVTVEDIDATLEAVKSRAALINLAAMLDRIEHRHERFLIVRHGRRVGVLTHHEWFLAHRK